MHNSYHKSNLALRAQGEQRRDQTFQLQFRLEPNANLVTLSPFYHLQCHARVRPPPRPANPYVPRYASASLTLPPTHNLMRLGRGRSQTDCGRKDWFRAI